MIQHTTIENLDFSTNKQQRHSTQHFQLFSQFPLHRPSSHQFQEYANTVLMYQHISCELRLIATKLTNQTTIFVRKRKHRTQKNDHTYSEKSFVCFGTTFSYIIFITKLLMHISLSLDPLAQIASAACMLLLKRTLF